MKKRQSKKKLTLEEVKGLAYMILVEGKSVSTDKLREVTGLDDREKVRALIRNLRKKIEPDPKQPTIITTERGKGYVFCDPTEPPS